jgi:hypothetical protein
MKNKFKIVETSDYILAVSDEEIQQGDICLKEIEHYGKHIMIARGIGDTKSTTAFWRKIIAYQPKGNATELDIPLLPKIVIEEDIEKLALLKGYKYYPYNDINSEIALGGFIRGYKAATKKYSEVDLYTAFNVGRTYEKSNHEGVSQYELVEYIQSLKQHITPKWFVADRQKLYHAKRKGITEFQDTKGYYSWILKTETNSEGKTYLVGTYLYE